MSRGKSTTKYTRWKATFANAKASSSLRRRAWAGFRCRFSRRACGARTYDRYARIGTFLGPDRVIVSAPSYACMPRTCVSRNTSEGARISVRLYRVYRDYLSRIFQHWRLICIALATIREHEVKNEWQKDKQVWDIITIFTDQNE